jgi:hypothetical protein
MAEYPRPEPAKIRGKVTRADYGKGSKSERIAIFIETDTGRYLLRRKNGPAFMDAELNKYVGRTVACDGFVVGTTFIADHIAILKHR